VQVRESQDGTVRIFLGDVELPARPFPKDNRVRQGAIVSHKLLAGALTVIQGQQQERDRQRLEEQRLGLSEALRPAAARNGGARDSTAAPSGSAMDSDASGDSTAAPEPLGQRSVAHTDHSRRA